MKKTLFFMTLLLAFSPATARAQENPNWLSDKERLEELANEKQNDDTCQAEWDILWSWAKKGNLEARALLFAAVGYSGLILPGHTDDSLSRVHDVKILAIHSIGLDYEDLLVADMYKGLHIEELGGGPVFLKCVAEKNSKECATVAVTEKLAPSFEDFAKEIDMFLAAGEKAVCKPIGP